MHQKSAMTLDTSLEESIWAHTAPRVHFPCLEGKVRAQVAIIGGGYTGCVAALRLAERGVDVVLLEGREVGWGGSGRNSGLVNAGLWLNPSEIVDHFGEVYGDRLVKGLANTPTLVRELIERHNIDCDAGRPGMVKAAHTNSALSKIGETARQWKSLGAAVELLDADGMAKLTGTRRYPGGLLDHRSFTIEPLAFARGLAKAASKAGARIFVESPVHTLELLSQGARVGTNSGEVAADRVIVATGAYDSKLVRGMARGFVPLGYFLFATEPLTANLREVVLPGKMALWDTSPSLLTLRYDRDYRLLVGNLGWLPSARSGHKWALSVLHSTFPQVGSIRFTHGWSGTLDFTDDHMPWLARPMPNVHMVGGFNGRGIGPGAYWGGILADWAMGSADTDLPIPVAGPPAIRFRSAKRRIFSAAFRFSRTASQLLR
jgi:glycine/D-amino acid oxidase-like deaminating enzyme